MVPKNIRKDTIEYTKRTELKKDDQKCRNTVFADCLDTRGPEPLLEKAPLAEASIYILAAETTSRTRKKQTRLLANKARGPTRLISHTLVKKSCPAPPEALCPEPEASDRERRHRARLVRNKAERPRPPRQTCLKNIEPSAGSRVPKNKDPRNPENK